METNGESKRNQIDRYVNDQMEDQERVAFEQRMKEHVELAESVHLHRDVQEGTSYFFATELKEVLKQSDLQKPKKNLKTYLAIAASIIVVAGAGLAFYFLGMNPTPAEVYATYYEPYPNILAPVTRSANDTPYSEAMLQYESGNYAATIEELNKLLQADDQNGKEADIEIKFYRGVAFLASEKPEPAMTDFQEVINAGETNLLDPAIWYLGLSKLKLYQLDEAKRTFQELSEKSGPFARQAREILKDLE